MILGLGNIQAFRSRRPVPSDPVFGVKRTGRGVHECGALLTNVWWPTHPNRFRPLHLMIAQSGTGLRLTVRLEGIVRNIGRHQFRILPYNGWSSPEVNWYTWHSSAVHINIGACVSTNNPHRQSSWHGGKRPNCNRGIFLFETGHE